MISALTYAINSIAQHRGSHHIHLLKALPLLHLLRGDCAAHEQSVIHPSDIVWTDPCVNLNTANQLMYHKKGSVLC